MLSSLQLFSSHCVCMKQSVVESKKVKIMLSVLVINRLSSERHASILSEMVFMCFELR